MATLATTAGFIASLCSQTPVSGHQFSGKRAATNIPSGSPCYVGTDDLLHMSGGVTVEGPTANVVGFTIQNIIAGNVGTLFHDERINYGDNVVVNQGYYASGTVAGQLVDVKPFATARPCAVGLPDGRLQLIAVIY